MKKSSVELLMLYVCNNSLHLYLLLVILGLEKEEIFVYTYGDQNFCKYMFIFSGVGRSNCTLRTMYVRTETADVIDYNVAAAATLLHITMTSNITS